MSDYVYGKDYIEPHEIQGGGVTRDHVRRWKVLQELQVGNKAYAMRGASVLI